ncbi:L-ascorbate metabolism protein UlaG (beta-lactamase superfamily) [Neorhizobium galegae]|uniref:MBL fold metallo-hydrolase n=1 Tax=Neorhizobium galegae TaxID=399 RepID=UPI001AE306BD|nr:MBL fold metallo-hydrolase [Neorhizobium galegae]MBP2560091.1 L-ascorbate metabolism protein UlaG (beta-lactamase superfamily) [Neorhizobium galegae]
MNTTITRYEQSGITIQSRDKMLAIDIGKLTPAETVAGMPKPHASLVSHRHADHFCPEHLRVLGAPTLAPGDVLPLVGEGQVATELQPGRAATIAGYTITALEADHGPNLSAPIQNLGFIIRSPDGHSLYFAGDIARPGVLSMERFDTVVLPVSGAGFVFNAAEALEYLELIGHRGRVIPVHDTGPSDPDAVKRFVALAPNHLEVIALAVGASVEVSE